MTVRVSINGGPLFSFILLEVLGFAYSLTHVSPWVRETGMIDDFLVIGDFVDAFFRVGTQNPYFYPTHFINFNHKLFWLSSSCLLHITLQLFTSLKRHRGLAQGLDRDVGYVVETIPFGPENNGVVLKFGVFNDVVLGEISILELDIILS